MKHIKPKIFFLKKTLRSTNMPMYVWKNTGFSWIQDLPSYKNTNTYKQECITKVLFFYHHWWGQEQELGPEQQAEQRQKQEQEQQQLQQSWKHQPFFFFFFFWFLSLQPLKNLCCYEEPAQREEKESQGVCAFFRTRMLRLNDVMMFPLLDRSCLGLYIS